MANEKQEICILSGARTPFGRFGGSLKDFDYFDLGAIPIREVLKRVGIEGKEVDEVVWGVGDTSACKDVYTPVAARQTLLNAGLPPQTPSLSLDKACVSAMSAVMLGWRAMRCGDIRIAIGGGATSFSQEPYILRKARFDGFRLGNIQIEDPLYRLGYKDFNPVATDTGIVALRHYITRDEQDEWALRSHQRYGKAWEEGKFKEEIISLELPQKNGKIKILDIDEQYREDVTLERLAKLPTIYESPTVTAGNAPGLNDGAAAILFSAKTASDELGIKPIASILGMVSVATDPNLLPEAPALAIERVLDQTELSLDDIDIIEINEAFAAVPLVSTKILAERYYGRKKNKLQQLRDKTNINGSAIAIGHPNTASGARIIMTLCYELKRRGGGLAIGAICGGLAQADACILKVT
jgi:acetyl-CoA C-acetyltransferase